MSAALRAALATLAIAGALAAQQTLSRSTASGAPVAWGAVTGTLASQTDLNTALAAKAPLVAPTFTGPVTVTGATGVIDYPCITTPAAPATGQVTPFCNSANANHWSLLNSSGVVTDLQAASAAPGALILLEEYTASASGAITFTSRNVTGQSGASFQSDFDEYEVHIVGMVPSATMHTGIRVSTNGGTSWDSTSGNYRTDIFQWRAATSAVLGSSVSQTAIWLVWPGADDTTTTAGWGLSGKFTLFAPLSTTLFKQLTGRVINFNSAGVSEVVEVRGAYQSNTVVNALQVFADTGNFASGNFRLYGISK